jgi:type III secretion system-like peptide-binding chaperone
VLSPVLWGIVGSADLLSAINDANTRVRFGRLFWTGQEVMAAMEVPAVGIVPEDVAFACFQIGAIADHFDDEFQKRFGGATMFGHAVSSKDDAEHPRHPLGFQPPS